MRYVRRRDCCAVKILYYFCTETQSCVCPAYLYGFMLDINGGGAMEAICVKGCAVDNEGV